MADGDEIQFVDCSSLNISIDQLGYVSLSYTLISNYLDVDIITDYFGVSGWPINIRQEPLRNVKEFYTTQVTIKGTRNTEEN